ncbi:hypothetical protein AN958_07162 [Leucoagaricus sp. SymC.cos]|nr:hypothetical protein AN958_07162 [Leucoagaricus sp. SymC.cos]
MSHHDNSHSKVQQSVVPISTGVSLQVDLIKPSPAISDDDNKLAICLHPWSWLGGRKDDPVLDLLTDSLLEGKYHILRYNSRSVGKSTGFSSFTGFSEAEDLRALVRWALDQIGNVTSLVLIGYSHGSLITSLHPVLAAPIKTSHVLLSYPLGPRGWLTLFRTSHYQEQLERLLRDPGSNVLVVFGDRDEFTGISSYKAWVEKLEKAAQGSTRLTIAEVPNASHFWHGRSGLEMTQSPVPEPPASTVLPAVVEPTTNGSSEPKVEEPEIPPEPAPVPVPTQPEPTAKAIPQTKLAPSKTRTPSKPPTSTRTPPSTVPKAIAKTPSSSSRPSPKSAASSPPSQPLRPQHTGQSTTSNSAKKPATKATPATPSRPKTPSRTIITPSRSSNLYAPTASSLARSRNAPPPAPTSAKKTMSTGASERLSKPTAASLQRARTPVASPPAKTTTLPKTATTPRQSIRGSAPTTWGTSRGGKIPSTPSKTPAKKAESTTPPKPTAETTAGAAVATTTVTTAAATVGTDQDVFPTKETSEAEPQVEPTIPASSEPEAEPEVPVEEDHQDDSTVIEPEVKVVVSEEENGHAAPEDATSSPQPENQLVPEPEAREDVNGSAAPANVEEASHEEAGEQDVDPITDKLAALASKHDGTDIEQIVNLLETGPVTKAASDTITTPSELQEIPDEEH